jgi:ABC-type branched-subunit amino acid transport system substrate-binding protein
VARIIPRERRRLARRFCAVAAVAGLALLAACSSGGGSSSGGSSGQSVPVGFLGEFGSPAFSFAADDSYAGAEAAVQYLQSHGGLYNHDTLDLIKGNAPGVPSVTIASTRKLLSQGVRLFVGPGNTSDCVAAAPLLDQAGAIYLIECASAPLTGASRTDKNVYRFFVNDTLMNNALANMVAKYYKNVQSIDVIGYDYNESQQAWQGFKTSLAALGLTPQAAHVMWVPLGTTNYSAQVSALSTEPKNGEKRILFLLTYGPGVLDVLKAALPLGVVSNYEAILTEDEYYVEAKAFNGTAPAVWNSYGTCDASMWNNPLMAYLTKYMQTNEHRLPDDWSVWGFNQILALGAGINKAQSSDAAKVNAAMASLTVNTANGEMTMNPSTHQAEMQVPACETTGSTSATEGVKLTNSTLFPFSQLAG